MYRKIIVGYDGLDGAKDALALGQALGEATGGELVVVGVFPHGAFIDPEQESAFARTLQATAVEFGVQAEAFPSGSPARGLHDAAEELAADLIVVGSAKGTQAGHMSAGNVGLQLLHGSPCAVAVAPAGFRDHAAVLGTIGVAVDGSAESNEALASAVALARATDAGLRLVTVAVPPASAFGWGYGVFDIEREMREVFQGHLDDAAKGVPADVEVKTDLVFGTPVSKALAEAAADLDLLYVGSRGYGPLRRVLLGSISAHLVKHASCAVVVTPRGVAAEGAMDDDKVVAEHA